jgi:hypothetical protein
MTDTSAPRADTKWDAQAIAGGGLCVAALFLDIFGWILAIAGVLVVRRAAIRTRTKWLLGAIALVPKVLFVGIRWWSRPAGVSFTFEPWTLATSSTFWAWTGLLIGFGVLLVLQSRSPRYDPAVTPTPPKREYLPAVVGLVLIIGGAALLLGFTDDFHRIDDAGGGRWALKHAARGTVATFSRDEVASIEGTVQHSSKGASRDSVRVTLTDGRTFTVTTQSSEAFTALRAFACTANLPAGRARITPWRGTPWTNGSSGFSLTDYVGTYDSTDAAAHEHRVLEFRIERDRLVGHETVESSTGTFVRTLRDIKASETGETDFSVETAASTRELPNGSTVFHLHWSPGGEHGRLTKTGFETGVLKFIKR